MITIKLLKQQFPYAADALLAPILNVCNSTKDKLIKAHFLAQLAHESDGFKTVQEYASGKAYEGRKDLGNVNPGDGVRFKGRGYIQLTGRANYAIAAIDLSMDLLLKPEQLLEPEKALEVSQWFWAKHGLDVLALKDDLNGITRKINGGTNGIINRARCLRIFKEIL